MIDDVAAFENTAAQSATEINLPEDALIVRDTNYLDKSGHADCLKYTPDNGFVAGRIAPAFGERGGGVQYHLPLRIEQLLGEYLEEVTQ